MDIYKCNIEIVKERLIIKEYTSYMLIVLSQTQITIDT